MTLFLFARPILRSFSHPTYFFVPIYTIPSPFLLSPTGFKALSSLQCPNFLFLMSWHYSWKQLAAATAGGGDESKATEFPFQPRPHSANKRQGRICLCSSKSSRPQQKAHQQQPHRHTSSSPADNSQNMTKICLCMVHWHQISKVLWFPRKSSYSHPSSSFLLLIPPTHPSFLLISSFLFLPSCPHFSFFPFSSLVHHPTAVEIFFHFPIDLSRI
jgi:hypothetical protein